MANTVSTSAIRVLHVSTYDIYGGAARAAYRIHSALRDYGASSRMLVLRKNSADPDVIVAPRPSYINRLRNKVNGMLMRHMQRNWRTRNTTLHSYGYTTQGVVELINEYDVDVINLHWISGILSIEDIARIRKPVVWTLHDMWSFCGAEHYTYDDSDVRYIEGYTSKNRPQQELGEDVNRVVWERKVKMWSSKRFTIVGPSRWIADCARQSSIFTRQHVHVVPYPIDSETMWKPVRSEYAREVLGLPLDVPIVLTGAVGGVADPRKGGDLVFSALSKTQMHGVDQQHLAIFGSNGNTHGPLNSCVVHWLGHISDDRLMKLVYSAADVMVVGSRRENLGQTAIEALACGVPVVAFAIGGNVDIVDHRVNGYLAAPFDIEDLSLGITWALESSARSTAIRQSARSAVINKYSPGTIADKYVGIYRDAVERKNS